jgi:hypothetical protein
MNKKALILGLTAGLHAFVFTWIGGHLLTLMDFEIPYTIIQLGMLLVSFLVAWQLADFLEGEDEPPPLVVWLLILSAGYFVAAQIYTGLGQEFGIGRWGRFARSLMGWSLVATCLFTTRFIRHRIMLFLGVAAFAMQFHASMILGAWSMRVPYWLLEMMTFVVAVLIARALCFGEESPADRVSNPLFLWLFSATGTLSLIFTVHELILSPAAQMVVWLGFLVSFVLLVRQIEPDEPDHVPSTVRPGPVLMFCLFIATLVAVGGVFHVSDIVSERVPFSAGEGLHAWLPVGVTAVIAVVILLVLQLSQRVRGDGPGRTPLYWGVALYFVGVLLGGSIFGVVSNQGRLFEALVSIYWVVLLVVPIMVAAQVLTGVGLLRILFNLDHRPR